jgi:uncharacterized protein (DUF302 family)
MTVAAVRVDAVDRVASRRKQSISRIVSDRTGSWRIIRCVVTTTGNGIVTRRSPRSFRDTVSRVEQAARGSGAQLFGRVDHAANAKLAGLAMEPTELLIFGRPDASTPLIQERRTSALDLPLKILVWRDNQDVWLTYNDIGYIALRHGATAVPNAVAAMHAWFDAVIEAALEE